MRTHTAYLATLLTLPYMGCASSNRESQQVWPVSSPTNVYVDSIPAAMQSAEVIQQVATVAFQLAVDVGDRQSSGDAAGSAETAATQTWQSNDY